ncbi:hypothetical protein RRG08_051696 [Elysia crispata]|uniref:Uncharacterized protein n=1 Tax=Elysia crispata TaxID=231223 RepID=A0AAE1AFK6_9GAST|nr:hypothetical protein RRG08_051696 [Elysia crispata]
MSDKDVQPYSSEETDLLTKKFQRAHLIGCSIYTQEQAGNPGQIQKPPYTSVSWQWPISIPSTIYVQSSPLHYAPGFLQLHSFLLTSVSPPTEQKDVELIFGESQALWLIDPTRPSSFATTRLVNGAICPTEKKLYPN